MILELKDRRGVWSNNSDSVETRLISQKIGYNFALEGENIPFRGKLQKCLLFVQ